MKKTKLQVIAFISLLVSGLYPGPARAQNVHGHLLDTQWTGLLQGSYSSIEVTITPQVGDSDSYYFANNVWFRDCAGAECIAYGGLQTNGYNGSAWIGKMAIFSIWNATSAVAEPGGTAVSFGGEGVGQSVRLPFQWQVGVPYRFRIYLDTDGTSKLWAASVTNLKTNATTRIGRIYAPAGYGLIYGPVTFHERYGGPAATCQTVTPSQVRFSNMTANGGSVTSNSWHHYYRAPLSGCPNFWVRDSGDGFSSGIGVPPPAPAASSPPRQPAPAPAPPPVAPPANTTPPATTPPPPPPVLTQPSQAQSPWPLALALLVPLLGVALFAAGWRLKRYHKNRF